MTSMPTGGFLFHVDSRSSVFEHVTLINSFPFFVPHWRNLDSEPTFSAKGMPPTPIFGATLEEAVRASHITGTPMVPAVLYRCAEYLEAKGADEVGLYR